MTFAETPTWFENLLARNEKALAETAATVGFAEPAKTATNLALLQGFLENPELVTDLARQALLTADPDQALNNLERLSGIVDKSDLSIALIDQTSARQLLTILGASSFLSGILCRRASFFAGLFRKGQIKNTKTEEQMCTELRQMVSDQSDTAALKKGVTA